MSSKVKSHATRKPKNHEVRDMVREKKSERYEPNDRLVRERTRVEKDWRKEEG
jgi:hypothetical protein